MTWTTEYARSVGLPLLASGVRFSLWDYECDATTDRLAVNDTHVLSMLLSASSDAAVRHGLKGGGYSAFGELGSLLLAPAGVPLHTMGRPLRTKVARLEICPGRYDFLDTFMTQLKCDQFALCRDIASHDIRESMRKLALEAAAPGPLAGLLVEGICSTIVVELTRHLDTTPSALCPAKIAFTTSELRLVTDYIEANINRNIRIGELANLFGLSVRHFTRRFRQQTGQSVHEFVGRARLHQVLVLLSDQRLPVKEVAHRMGFASQANFSDTFFRQTGERPGAYRRRQIGNVQ